MPRIATAGLSLAQIERMLESRRAEMNRLSRQRDRLQRKLDGINAKINAISGGVLRGRPPGGSIRARNNMSLQDTLVQVLGKSGGPMSVSDILNKVLATGYRSNSANFRGIVNQTLIKDKRFGATSRGMYQLKK